jgi:hypothetical protein
MGLLTKAVSREVNRELKRLKGQSPYEYDALMSPNKTEALRDRFTRSMLINSVWYNGSDIDLKQLYQRDLATFKIGTVTTDELNYFWAQPTEGMNIRKIHSGIPQLISEKMVDLIKSNGYEYVVYQDKDLTERDDDNQERLESILEDNYFESMLDEAIETASWSGGVAFKWSTREGMPYPILEVIQPEEYEPRVESGRIVEDIFIKYFMRDNSLYKLKERYGIDANGGYIRYEMYRKTETGWSEANLTDIEETKDLEDIQFTNVYEKFSLYIPNKLPNSEFRGSRLGESDYSGSHGLFDAIDEVISTMVQEFRDGKIKNFWPSDLLPVDPTSKQQYLPPALKKDFITYNSGIGEKERPTKPEMMQGDIHSEKYIETFKKLIEQVLNNAGLSPQTIGVTGLESTSASEESQELREKTSIRTRERKIKLLTQHLNKLFQLGLMLDDINNNKQVGEYVIDIHFNDYKIQTIEDRTAIASQGLTSKTWDIKTAVDYIHDDLTDEEKTLMVVNIKIENGINVFTKEEELIYKKYVMETIEENQEIEQEVEAFVETEATEPIEEEPIEE